RAGTDPVGPRGPAAALGPGRDVAVEGQAAGRGRGPTLDRRPLPAPRHHVPGPQVAAPAAVRHPPDRPGPGPGPRRGTVPAAAEGGRGPRGPRRTVARVPPQRLADPGDPRARAGGAQRRQAGPRLVLFPPGGPAAAA